MVEAWAHPRVCGENAAGLASNSLGAGSSPRVRGKPIRETIRPHEGGLIPACAGKTQRLDRACSARRAHPRVCGENASQLGVSGGCTGSSPRVRGKRLGGVTVAALTGLIPACAGKTVKVWTEGQARPAHPRVCGENKRL